VFGAHSKVPLFWSWNFHVHPIPTNAGTLLNTEYEYNSTNRSVATEA
jgi:hypothetical protein